MKKAYNNKLQIWNWKRLCLLLVSAVALLIIFAVGPLDYFSHGFFCEEIDYAEVAASGIDEYIDLGEKDYEIKFKTREKHFAGFEINLANQPKGNSGILCLDVVNQRGKKVDTIKVDLKKVSEGVWYKAYANSNLKRDQIYTLKISAKNCETYPYLQTVTSQYKAEEVVEGNLLIRFAYKQSTFLAAEKIFIILFTIAIWMFIFGTKMENTKLIKPMRRGAVFLLFMTLLSWNYMYNSMDDQNLTFENFQADSESLVKGSIYALHDGIGRKAEYGLAVYLKKSIEPLTDDNWTSGYSNGQPAICIFTNPYVKRVAIIGNIVQFDNGSRMTISNVVMDEKYTSIYFDSQEILNESIYGNLSGIQFMTQDGTVYGETIYAEYKSQYGLQGKVFCYFSQKLDCERAFKFFNILCCLVTGFVFMLIVMLIQKKSNNLLAGCFFVVFWLSPWIVNFARNLYWVEFTWFLPMAFGLLCAWKIEEKKMRILSYFGIFVSILIKSLCGYEYISVIMMGAIAFLLVDLIKAFAKKQREDGLLLLKSIIIIGIMAFLGFFIAICIHATLRGGGDISEGIKSIFIDDVLRRTNGADLNDYLGRPEYTLSLTASIWETVCLYFHFPTEVVAGISGNLFQIMIILPLGIFIFDINKKQYDYEKIAMYIIFFLTSVSWYVLAKSHSYIHVHMNYVLWYFGFIQVCFYIILDKVISLFGKEKKVDKEV